MQWDTLSQLIEAKKSVCSGDTLSQFRGGYVGMSYIQNIIIIVGSIEVGIFRHAYCKERVYSIFLIIIN